MASSRLDGGRLRNSSRRRVVSENGQSLGLNRSC
jgi:hypothetical protein